MGRKKNILNKPAGSLECIWDAGLGLATKPILMCCETPELKPSKGVLPLWDANSGKSSFWGVQTNWP